MVTQSDEGFLNVQQLTEGLLTQTSVYSNVPTILNTSDFTTYTFHVRSYPHIWAGPEERFFHSKADGDYYVPNNTGGWTIVVLVDKKLNRGYMGVSRCSNREQYDKKRGRQIAQRRALEAVSGGKKFVGPQILYRTEERSEDFAQVLSTLPNWVIGKVFIS